MSSYAENKRNKRNKEFSPFYSFRAHLFSGVGAGEKDRCLGSIPSYRPQYERWNYSGNSEKPGAGEISYLYIYELKWLGSIYIVSL